jgi:hypothetical protein
VSFTRADTTYPALVAFYYVGGLVGGLLIGFAWPLRKWLLGSVVLGIMGIFPLYLGAVLMNAPRSQLLTAENIGTGLLLSCLAGGPIGLWSWLDSNPARRPPLLNALLFPRARTLAISWIVAIAASGGSYLFVAEWSKEWGFGIIVVIFLVLFVSPLAVALLVTLRFARTYETRP